MKKLLYVEEIFQHFYLEEVQPRPKRLESRDYSAASSFYITISNDKLLTENQRRYILNILFKYCPTESDVDYRTLLLNPVWKNPVRLIDDSKKVWVEQLNHQLYLCFKQPFSLNPAFEWHIGIVYKSEWNPSLHAKTILLYDTNLLAINEYVEQYNYKVDETYEAVLAQWEEIVDQQTGIQMGSTIVNGRVKLLNPTESAETFWNSRHTGNLADDLLLAKSMGYRLLDQPSDTITKIASCEDLFWTESFDRFFEIYNLISGKVCVVLDRAIDSKDWLTKFLAAGDHANVPRDSIRVCFRERKSGSDATFNQWIKDQMIAGDISDAKILIFQNKPAKWLIEQLDDVTIVVTNNIFPPTNRITYNIFDQHTCTIFLSEEQPSPLRNRKIANL